MNGSVNCTARFERLADSPMLDLDGDGRGDFVVYAASSPAMAAHARQASSGGIVQELAHPGVLRAGDFNGDGRSDIFAYDPVAGAWSLVGGPRVRRRPDRRRSCSTSTATAGPTSSSMTSPRDA